MSRDIQTQQLWKALKVEDQKITEAGNALEVAKMDFDIESVRYAAVRDLLRYRLGKNPYSTPVGANLPSEGAYRYLDMPIGDAVLEVLDGVDGPLSARDVAMFLSQGGARFEDGRVINAALMTFVRTEQITKIIGKDGEIAHFEALHEPDWEDNG